MKNVAIIAYYFFEDNIVGSLRARGLAKYLSDYGWRPTIVTKNAKSLQNESYDLVGIDFLEFDRAMVNSFDLYVAEDVVSDKVDRSNSLVNKGIEIWNDITQIPDAQRNWDRACYSYLKERFRDSEFDAIITTSAPYSSHLLGSKVRRTFGIPWIADMRDLWSQNHFYIYSKYRNKIDAMLERRILRDADAIVTVSDDLAKKIRKLHPENDVRVINNGYDPMEFSNEEVLDDVFSIVYAGKIYDGFQDIDRYFEVVQGLLDKGRISQQRISIEVFGADLPGLSKMITERNLGDVVKNSKRIPRKEMVNKLMRTQVLLFLTWNDPDQKGIVTGKIYDYMAAKRPIMSSGNFDDEASSLIIQANAGTHSKTKDELERRIVEAYDEFCAKGRVQYQGDVKTIEKFSQKGMANNFASLLDELEDEEKGFGAR